MLKPKFYQKKAMHNDLPNGDSQLAISKQKHETFFDWLPVTKSIMP
jgi:hypothetical protein